MMGVVFGVGYLLDVWCVDFGMLLFGFFVYYLVGGVCYCFDVGFVSFLVNVL